MERRGGSSICASAPRQFSAPDPDKSGLCRRLCLRPHSRRTVMEAWTQSRQALASPPSQGGMESVLIWDHHDGYVIGATGERNQRLIGKRCQADTLRGAVKSGHLSSFIKDDMVMAVALESEDPPTTDRAGARNRRIEVITGRERRRRWTGEQKREIAAGEFAAGVSPIMVARSTALAAAALYGGNNCCAARSARCRHQAALRARRCYGGAPTPGGYRTHNASIVANRRAGWADRDRIVEWCEGAR